MHAHLYPARGVIVKVVVHESKGKDILLSGLLSKGRKGRKGRGGEGGMYVLELGSDDRFACGY